MKTWALLKGNTVKNIIAVDDDSDFAMEYADDHPDYDDAVDVTGSRVGPGWVLKGKTYVEPYTLDADVFSIPPDDSTAATFTYTDNTANPPSSIDGDVNGQPVTVQLASGVGTLAVTSKSDGDTVTVSLGGLSRFIRVVTQ